MASNSGLTNSTGTCETQRWKPNPRFVNAADLISGLKTSKQIPLRSATNALVMLLGGPAVHFPCFIGRRAFLFKGEFYEKHSVRRRSDRTVLFRNVDHDHSHVLAIGEFMSELLSTSEENDLSEFRTDAHEEEWKKLSIREQQIFLCGVRHVLQQINTAKEIQ